MTDEDYDEQGEFTLTVKGLQFAVDNAGKRCDEAEVGSFNQHAAILDLIIFSSYARLRGWEMLNRVIIGMDVE